MPENSMSCSVLLPTVDVIRMRANAELDQNKKSQFGQFFTSAPICLFMSSLFTTIKDDVHLLDPGCGSGSLTAAFIAEAIRRGETTFLKAYTNDLEEKIIPFISETLLFCEQSAKAAGIDIETEFHLQDYLLFNESKSSLSSKTSFTHCIMNPPYKKIGASSEYRNALRTIGIEAGNLYTGFLTLAIHQLKLGGELVAIVPRSFCNGPYYQNFRKFMINETAIKQIHIFDSRHHAFSDDDVLQENIIIHLIKGQSQKDVKITSSPTTNFHIDKCSGTVTASDMTTRIVPFSNIISPNDDKQFIHIAANNRDQAIINRLSNFISTLNDLNVEVSTGPVVDFRLKAELRQNIENGAAPLIYPVHLNGAINWPKKSRKPNAILINDNSERWLWKNEGYFVIVRRFSSKEEKRRIVASFYNGSLPGKIIGFENKLNVFHYHKKGMDKKLALGLYVYLNSTLLDKYYRLFGGHTQVNATDLRNMRYPCINTLRRIGGKIKNIQLTQKEIDDLINEEIIRMTGHNDSDPLRVQEKIDQALEIIGLLGMPKAQQNERSALTLLALLNLHPEREWSEAKKPQIGVTPIMDWVRDIYGKEYAPNTRETFRRQTLHQFVDGGLVLYNPDKPDRAVNSPKACYQLAPQLFEVLITYGTNKWEKSIHQWLKSRETLVSQYAKVREMQMIPLTLDDGTEICLSPGSHSQLIHDIVTEFGPRFAPASQVIYLGDTGAKDEFFRKERLLDLGVVVNRKGKLPDVVLYWPERDWLLLIESVTSHGPVDSKRHNELINLFKDAKPGLIYVTAFPDRKTMAKYLADISWETEVWVAESPTHMIHFNGDRFLGPYNQP